MKSRTPKGCGFFYAEEKASGTSEPRARIITRRDVRGLSVSTLRHNVRLYSETLVEQLIAGTSS